MNCTHCRRELRWQSVKLGLNQCRQCRRYAKAKAQERVEREVGRIVGEYLASVPLREGA
jgi:hypothetical protein